MPAASRLPAASYPLHRRTLRNGLRVVLAPDRSSPAITVNVTYDVGFRSEPAGRTGFAHLFEHLMFQGSAHVGKLEHARHVQSSGGVLNGSTRHDFTNYFEALPSNALARALYLEADRMAGPAITRENLENQIAVVKEEIRINIKNRPYGGFPWLMLPQVLFDTFANAHDGYGDFDDLDAATVADAAAFFERFYAPNNAVLCVAGDLDVEAANGLIDAYFGRLPRRRATTRADYDEPDLTAERRSRVEDPLAPIPAVAAAWRVPDPVRDLPAYLANVVLGEILTDGDSSRLQRRLVQTDRTVTSLAGYVGLMGDPFSTRGPTALVLQAIHLPTAMPHQILDAIAAETERVAAGGPTPGELDGVKARIVTQLLRELDPIVHRADRLAFAELVFGSAELVMDLPTRIGAVSADDVREAAATLRPDRRAVVQLVPAPPAAPVGGSA